MEKMLPISFDEKGDEKASLVTFELEPDRETILNQLLPQYAESMIYGSIVDAKTAEHEMSPKRYHMFKWLHRMELPTFLLILILVLFVRSVEGFVLAMIFYAICGIVAYSRYFDYTRNS